MLLNYKKVLFDIEKQGGASDTSVLLKEVAELANKLQDDNEFKDVMEEKLEGNRYTLALKRELVESLKSCDQTEFDSILEKVNYFLNNPDKLDDRKSIWDLKVLKTLLEQVKGERDKKTQEESQKTAAQEQENKNVYDAIAKEVNSGKMNHLDDVLKEGGYTNNLDKLQSFLTKDWNYMDALYLLSKMNERKGDKMGSSDDKNTYRYITDIIWIKYGLDTKNLDNSRIGKKQLDLVMQNNSLQNLAKILKADSWDWNDLKNATFDKAKDFNGHALFESNDLVSKFNEKNGDRKKKNEKLISDLEKGFKLPDNFSTEKFELKGEDLYIKGSWKEDQTKITDEIMLKEFKNIFATELKWFDCVPAEEGVLFGNILSDFTSQVKDKLKNGSEKKETPNSGMLNFKYWNQDWEWKFITQEKDGTYKLDEGKLKDFISHIDERYINTYSKFINGKTPKEPKWRRPLVFATQRMLNIINQDKKDELIAVDGKKENKTNIAIIKFKGPGGDKRLDFKTFEKIRNEAFKSKDEKRQEQQKPQKEVEDKKKDGMTWAIELGIPKWAQMIKSPEEDKSWKYYREGNNIVRVSLDEPWIKRTSPDSGNGVLPKIGDMKKEINVCKEWETKLNDVINGDKCANFIIGILEADKNLKIKKEDRKISIDGWKYVFECWGYKVAIDNKLTERFCWQENIEEKLNMLTFACCLKSKNVWKITFNSGLKPEGGHDQLNKYFDQQYYTSDAETQTQFVKFYNQLA